jgi:hypothetical protein
MIYVVDMTDPLGFLRFLDLITMSLAVISFTYIFISRLFY